MNGPRLAFVFAATAGAATSSLAWADFALGELDGFVVTRNAGIPAQNQLRLYGHTPQQCAARCKAEAWCRSFDYHRAAAICDLSRASAPSGDRLSYVFPGNPMDHYGLAPPFFRLTRNAAIPGFNTQRLVDKTPQACAHS